MAEKLEAVYRVIGARGKVRQKRSRPLRAQLTFSCPKASLMLETSSEAKLTLFEVATHELNCTVLAGSHNSRQLQSGNGPISVDVRLSQKPYAMAWSFLALWALYPAAQPFMPQRSPMY